MKITTFCPICFQEDNHPLNSTSTIHLQNQDIQKVICQKGHEFYFKLQNEKYQLIYDSAVCAYYDDYLSEAIVGFVSAFESFMSYFIKLYLFKNNINFDEMDDLFKDIKLAERKKGTFLFCYYMEFKEHIKDFNDYFSLRNKIAHESYIPNEEETLKVAKAIFELISEIVIKLKINYKGFGLFEANFIAYLMGKYKDINVGSSLMPCMLPHPRYIDTKSKIIFEKELERMKKDRLFMYGESMQEKIDLIKNMDILNNLKNKL